MRPVQCTLSWSCSNAAGVSAGPLFGHIRTFNSGLHRVYMYIFNQHLLQYIWHRGMCLSWNLQPIQCTIQYSCNCAARALAGPLSNSFCPCNPGQCMPFIHISKMFSIVWCAHDGMCSLSGAPCDAPIVMWQAHWLGRSSTASIHVTQNYVAFISTYPFSYYSNIFNRV